MSTLPYGLELRDLGLSKKCRLNQEFCTLRKCTVRVINTCKATSGYSHLDEKRTKCAGCAVTRTQKRGTQNLARSGSVPRMVVYSISVVQECVAYGTSIDIFQIVQVLAHCAEVLQRIYEPVEIRCSTDGPLQAGSRATE